MNKIFIAVLFINVIILNHSCASTGNRAIKPDKAVTDSKVSRQNETDKEPQDDEFDEFSDEFSDDASDEEISDKKGTVYDPLEPFNRAMFKFNDRLYYWFLKPVTKGYRFIFPKSVRVSVRRFFSNITTPVRFVNSILQLKFKSGAIELGRLIINSTIGIAGFMDPARKLKLYKQDEDFGQTLGYYGIGYGFYLNLPFFGPLTLRDTIGGIGDTFLDPTTFLLPIGAVEKIGIAAYKNVNKTSLDITFYDDIVKKAFDPYVFMKNAYYQIRESKIKK